ncbi:uncharacterized protein BCR38DRAFT_317839, partial [Pseudomassariella vexata]
GGSLHPAIEVYHDALTNSSFRVKDGCSIERGDPIVALPLSKTLSYLNAIGGHPDFPDFRHESFRGNPETAEWFPAEFLKETPPHVTGRFVLMQQYLLGRDSAWWPYIRTLPQPEHVGGMLPALWPNDDIEFLTGTNAYVAVQEIKSTLKKEYKAAMKLLPEKYAFKGYSRPLYLWSYGIFTSRSFRPSLIIPDGGSLGLSCDIDDFSLLLPLYDIGNHSPLARTTWSTDRETQICRLQAGQSCGPGEQVYNNYGMKTNAELLLGYGFVLAETDDFHNDYHHIKTKPTDDDDLASTHLVSLRPMNDPSTVTGRSRQQLLDDTEVLSELSHIQDSLVLNLYEAIGRATGVINEVSIEDLMAGKIVQEVKDKIITALGSKLSFDLETLDEVEIVGDELNPNQQLAVLYREQCRKVLENAL